MENKITRRGFMKTSLLAVAGAMSSPLIYTSSHASKAEHVLTFGHTFGEATEGVMITGLDVFKKKAEQYAEGLLLVDIHEAGSLGGQTVLPQKVLTNAIQGCQLSTQNFTPFSDVYNLLDFPYIFPSNEKFEEVLGSEAFLNSEFTKQPRSKGFMVLPGMWANAGFRVLGFSKKANRTVKVPKDLNDIKIRVTGSKIEQQIFQITPANPVSIAWGETYQALQQGAADALNVGLGPLTATKIFETLGSATLSEINFNSHISLLNARWFDKLPEKVQNAIIKAGKESFQYQKENQAKANTEMLKLWKESGIKIIELSNDEKQLWKDTLGHQLPVWDPFKEKYGADLYNKLLSWI